MREEGEKTSTETNRGWTWKIKVAGKLVVARDRSWEVALRWDLRVNQRCQFTNIWFKNKVEGKALNAGMNWGWDWYLEIRYC